MHNPFISIIIPSFNRVEFLKSNLPKLLNLDYDNYEIIVVDDGSTDNTKQLFETLKNEKLSFYSKQNEERAAARNYGAARAKGEYISFLDSDDELYNDALQNAAVALKEKNYPVFLHMAYDIGTISKINKRVNHLPDNYPLLLVHGNPLSCMGVFVKREAFLKHLFNPDRNLAGSEDWELWMRLAAHYGLRTDHRTIGRLIEHDDRSVINFPEEKLNKRKELAIQYAFADEAVEHLFGKYKTKIEAHWLTYVALHTAMSGNKKSTLKNFIHACLLSPISVMNKRGLVILKLLLFK